jgi:nicotinamidase-related amidase
VTTPQTLLEMSNRVPALPALRDATILLIDLQEEYRSGALRLDGIDAAIGRAAELLGRARVAGARIVHVAHAGAAGAMFDRTAPRGQIVVELAPLAGEAVVEKTLPCAFTGTTLREVLDEGGRRPLVVLGAMTHMCVSSTLRVASELGYAATLVGDGCATRDLPLPGGVIVPAAEVQRANLAALGDRFARVVTAADLA